jgi:hypothetical protein
MERKLMSVAPRLRRLAASLFLSCLLGAAAAPYDAVRPDAPAVRITPEEAPEIDGDLSDAAWSKATVIDDFRQVDPDSGMPGTERTVVRVMYDEDNLYLGIYSYDREPGRIILGTRTRDGNLGNGDLIRIFLDPSQTRRNGYSFEVGSSGARRDALVQNNGDFIVQWNTLWSARAQVVSDGWIAEIAIPFRSLSYNANLADWGFDFTRAIRRKEERVRWTSYSASINLFDISRSGTLTGISNLRQGLGLEMQAYGRVSVDEDWQHDSRTTLSGAAGGNLYYKVTTGLTGTLTVNPDFSDTPLDARQVNLSRFSLFLPETRAFFLQDASAFEFGGRNFQNANGRPFFSRNIGLVDGEPVTILGGAKLSGLYDNIGIGALSVRTNSKGTTPAQMLSAARVTTPVLGESKLGAIFTHGDPTGLSDNTVAGSDFQYRNTHFMGAKTLQADLYYERSFSSTKGDDDSFGVAFDFPNEPWGGWLRSRELGTDFTPALGFVNRPGIHVYEGGAVHITRFQDSLLRTLQFGTNNNVVTGLDNRENSRGSFLWATAITPRADLAELQVLNFYESVPATFDLPGSVPVPVGQYHWTNFSARVNTSGARPYAMFWYGECCSFYHGSYFRSDLGFTLRPSQAIEIVPRYVVTFISLPTGYVAIHVPSLEAAYNVTPDMQIAMQAQFDNISGNLGISARYRWEYAPGDELFAVFGQSASIPGTTLLAENSQLSLRLGHTLRF